MNQEYLLLNLDPPTRRSKVLFKMFSEDPGYKITPQEAIDSDLLRLSEVERIKLRIKQSSEEILLKPPKDFDDFRERLGIFVRCIWQLVFGINHDVKESKTLKQEKSDKAIIEALCNFEKFCREKRSWSEWVDAYPLLRSILEKDASLMEMDLWLLGTERDREGLSLPQKNEISVQCAGQVLWDFEGIRIPTIAAMICRLKKEDKLKSLLDLGRFYDDGTLRGWLMPVFPKPEEHRKSKNRLEPTDFEEIKPIPTIFSERGVNFLHLRFAVICYTRILRIFNQGLDQILESKVIRSITHPLHFYPNMYVRDWVEEAFHMNGCIFA
jgi:hypothetical protein